MSASERSIKDYAVIAVKGMGMGAADVVPGVSGGTIALITGIYQELLSSLKGLTPAALLVLFKEGFPAFWRRINGAFLLALFVGILLSIKTLASVVSWALQTYPLHVWGAFSGLIVASLWVLARQQGKWTGLQCVLFLLGAVFVVLIAEFRPIHVEATPWMLFFGGFIAICAMILPGISGSFLLLLMGLYPSVIRAVEELDLISLFTFAVGCICGLLTFSRFLSWLLARWYHNTLAVMLGFLLGSLYVTWPWKRVLETYVDRHGELVPLMQENVMPYTYEQTLGMSSQWGGVLMSFALGLVLVLMVEGASRFSNSVAKT